MHPVYTLGGKQEGRESSKEWKTEDLMKQGRTVTFFPLVFAIVRQWFYDYHKAVTFRPLLIDGRLIEGRVRICTEESLKHVVSYASCDATMFHPRGVILALLIDAEAPVLA